MISRNLAPSRSATLTTLTRPARNASNTGWMPKTIIWLQEGGHQRLGALTRAEDWLQSADAVAQERPLFDRGDGDVELETLGFAGQHDANRMEQGLALLP